MSKLKFILASESKRRKDILNNLGLKFKAVPSGFLEDEAIKDPFELVKRNSEGKANAVKKNHSNAIIIAADTVVFAENEILEKPRDIEDARRILNILSGSTHIVMTGICLFDARNNKSFFDVAKTEVKIEKLSEEVIEGYIKSQEGFGKAGAYAIQGLGSMFVKEIKGDYFNVVGLPVYLLRKMLFKIGISLEDVLFSEVAI